MIHATLIKSLRLLLIYSSQSQRYKCENELSEYRWWWKNIEPNQTQFIGMGRLSKLLCFIWKFTHSKERCQKLFEWLAEVFIPRWPTENELGMHTIPWFIVDERIFRLKKISILEWVHCKIKSTTIRMLRRHASHEFYNVKIEEMGTSIFKSFVIALLLVWNLKVRDTIVQLDKLTAMGLIGP